MRRCLQCQSLQETEVCSCGRPTFTDMQVIRLLAVRRAAQAAFYETAPNWAAHATLWHPGESPEGELVEAA